MLMPHVSLRSLAKANHFAYTKERGARDVWALLSLKWVAILDKSRKIALYCSDGSAAFDRVSSKRLLANLVAKGIDARIIKVIASWLEPRSATVVVGGAKPESFWIRDMVYQETVLGPQLSNLFFEDAAESIREFWFEEVVYADDLNAYRALPGNTENEKALSAVDEIQDEPHNWDSANQVTFDPTRKSKHVPSRRDPYGPNFKLLGTEYDCRLFMADAVRALVGKTKWKIKMLLRARRFYTLDDLLNQYKQQILSFVKYRTLAIYHATQVALSELDRIQDFFSAIWVYHSKTHCCTSAWLWYRCDGTLQYWACSTRRPSREDLLISESFSGGGQAACG